MRKPNPPTAARSAWVIRCIQRVQRQYRTQALLPGGDRGLIWSEYVRLVAQLLAEYRED